MCNLAEFYQAPPALSRSLDHILRVAKLMDAEETHTLAQYVSGVMDVAIKCRHRDLFSDCAIMLAGEEEFFEAEKHNGETPYKHTKDSYPDLDPKVRKIVLRLRRSTKSMMLQVNRKLMSLVR